MAAERNIYEREDGTWGWRLKSGGSVIATDGNQGYESESFCRKMADSIIGGDYADAKKTITRRKK
ncbi:hypothetical protein [Microbacterium sp. A1-JK]|uniref:hypothetical protein n=1 Tax=Microbacterium sp. A1-JK TaxID=3177516 RepID=UPI0038855255